MNRLSDKELVLLWEKEPRPKLVAELAGVSPDDVNRRVLELIKAGVKLQRVGTLRFAPQAPPVYQRPTWVHRLNAIVDHLRMAGVGEW